MDNGPTTSNSHFDHVLEEPSPIERRLAENRSYNDGDWNSVELKQLFDSVLKYGTKASTLSYISKNAVKTRQEEEIKVKLFELREYIVENKDDCREYYKSLWIEKGHREIPNVPGVVMNKDLDWLTAITMVMKNIHPTTVKIRNPIREALNESFIISRNLTETTNSAKVTDMNTARSHPDTTQEIRWKLIYKFMEACASLDSTLPALNELEAAIVCNVLDSIQDEAALMSDRDKAILVGMHTDIALNDLRGFEPDTPCDLNRSIQVVLDPLRTRFFGVPEFAAEPEPIHPNSRKNDL